MIIAVDIDDTLTTVDRAKYAGEYIARKGLPFRIKNPNGNKLVSVVDWTEEDAKAFVLDGGYKTFTEAPVREGARETLALWRKQGHKVVILTARQRDWFLEPEKLSRDFLEKNGLEYDEIVADCADKGDYCERHGIDVLVDDNIDNCAGAERHGVFAVLAAGRHCTEREIEIVYSAWDWAGIARCVEEIEKHRNQK